MRSLPNSHLTTNIGINGNPRKNWNKATLLTKALLHKGLIPSWCICTIFLSRDVGVALHARPLADRTTEYELRYTMSITEEMCKELC
jgi:hypothetical protein